MSALRRAIALAIARETASGISRGVGKGASMGARSGAALGATLGAIVGADPDDELPIGGGALVVGGMGALGVAPLGAALGGLRRAAIAPGMARQLAERLMSAARETHYYQTMARRLGGEGDEPAAFIGKAFRRGHDPLVFVRANRNEVYPVTALRDAQDGFMRVGDIPELPPNARGKGLGVLAYKRMIDEALSNDKMWRSDAMVSSHAVRMYQALARRGYHVAKHPRARREARFWVTDDGAPAFIISRAPITEADWRRAGLMDIGRISSEPGWDDIHL